jgi:hypothetical protein
LLAGAGSASAATFDPNTLCASATPTAAQVNDAVALLGTNTGAAAAAAHGLKVSLTGTDGTNNVSIFDAANGRTDLQWHDFRSTGHVVFDRGTSASYTYYQLGDGAKIDARLKVLGTSNGWLKEDVAASLFTGDGLAMVAASGGLLGFLDTSSGDGSTAHTFSCAVTPTQLTITDTYTDSSLKPAASVHETYTLAIDATGAVTSGTDNWVDSSKNYPDYVYTETDTYGAASAALPSPIYTQAQWKSALIRAYFPKMRTATVNAAKAKVKKLGTPAKRIAAVRALAKAKAKAFTYAAAKEINIAGGAKVQVKNPVTGKYWYFTMKVVGKTIKVTKTL